MTEPAPTADPKTEPGRLWTDSQAAFKRRDYLQSAELMQALLDRWGEDAAPSGAAALRLSLGVALLRLRRTPAGVEQLRRAVELDPGSGRAHQKLGAGLGRLGEDREALACFERATALSPDEAEYHWRLGEQLRRLGRPRDARAAFARCLELMPGYPPAVKAVVEIGGRRRGLDWLERLRRRLGLGRPPQPDASRRTPSRADDPRRG